MKSLPVPVTLLLFALAWAPANPSLHAEWKAGVARTVITPSEPMWMAGYGGRTAPASGKQTELYAKALYLEDGQGSRGILFSLDLVGVDRFFSTALCARLEKETGLSRAEIALCTSHTHSGPVVGQNLAPLHYMVLPPEHREKIDAYAQRLSAQLVALAREAMSAPVAVRLQAASGKATFAVNRRNNKPYSDVPEKRDRGRLEGPVDHDVPVLTVRDSGDRLVAILFGYACHATTLPFDRWDADYPGYAMTSLETRYPGSLALFWAGCGGDQNPLPRREVALARYYGRKLADAVSDTIDAPMPELSPQLAVEYTEIEAPLARIPERGELLADTESTNRFEVARARYLLERLEEHGGLEDHYPFPIGHWELGGRIDLIFLGGEVVIDYALRLKKERRGTDTWVAAYAHDVMAYIPSLRVLREGGYEGGGSNVYYGLPALWDESIEETIIRAVHSGSSTPE